MSRRELTELAELILAERDPARLGYLVQRFDDAVPHPAASDLFLFPWLEFGENHQPAAEEIVDAALDWDDPTRVPACTYRRRPRRRVTQRR